AQQIEQLALLGVIGAGRIAERGADAAVFLVDQIVVAEVLGGGVAPVAARARVQLLGERLRQPVGQRLDDDRAVVVQRLLVGGRQPRRARGGGCPARG